MLSMRCTASSHEHTWLGILPGVFRGDCAGNQSTSPGSTVFSGGVIIAGGTVGSGGRDAKRAAGSKRDGIGLRPTSCDSNAKLYNLMS